MDIVSMLREIEQEVNTVHPKCYHVSGHDPEVNNDLFMNHLATELYVDAISVYDPDQKIEQIFSDKMRLYLRILHLVYPELDTCLFDALTFAGVQESNFEEVLSIMHTESDDDEDDNEEYTSWFYRFQMKPTS